eukprot:scaffold59241_cov57-Phaeocystis_antarctica.AAC.10
MLTARTAELRAAQVCARLEREEGEGELVGGAARLHVHAHAHECLHVHVHAHVRARVHVHVHPCTYTRTRCSSTEPPFLRTRLDGFCSMTSSANLTAAPRGPTGRTCPRRPSAMSWPVARWTRRACTW